MDEARKTMRVRSPAFIRTMFAGRVIDIGCGGDLVVPHAEPFDLAQGDAQHIGRHHPPESFDTVHSSHCLEHMRDVPAALAGWWTLVRPSGHLIIVVPEEDLYKQGGWPSLFNRDHKATFRLNRQTAWSPVSYDIAELAQALPNSETIDARIQSTGYDPLLRRTRIGWRNRLFWKISKRRRRLFSYLRLRAPDLEAWLERLERMAGKPVDQTAGDALAQIQVVLRKRAE